VVRDALPKSHVLFVSPAWTRDRGPEFDADFLVGQLAESGIDWIELYPKDHHGNLYYPSELGADSVVTPLGRHSVPVGAMAFD
jgi:hypothetical protein